MVHHGGPLGGMGSGGGRGYPLPPDMDPLPPHLAVGKLPSASHHPGGTASLVEHCIYNIYCHRSPSQYLSVLLLLNLGKRDLNVSDLIDCVIYTFGHISFQ